MRLVIQSVETASVKVLPMVSSLEEEHVEAEGGSKRSISRGILIYLWISTADLLDYPDKIEKIVRKLPTIRFLEGEKGINLSLNDIDGEILLISNFTVYGRNHKGTSMEFTGSAPFTEAKAIYEYFIEEALASGRKLQTGEFWAEMQVTSENRGPINYVFDY